MASVNHKINKQRGFSLIELLVVIAIIALLSSLVLAAVNTARAKAQESKIVSTLKNIVAQASLIASSSGDFSNLCTDSRISKMVDSINNTISTSRCYVSNDSKRWAVSTRLNNAVDKNWSVDSNGVVVWDKATPGGDVTMTWDNAISTCNSSGGRLPSLEELISLNYVYGGLPPGFNPFFYWSINTLDDDDTSAKGARMDDNPPIEDYGPKDSTDINVRCVR